MRITRTVFRRLAKAMACLVVVVLVDVGLTYALRPFGNIEESTWYNYRNTPQGEIDTLIVGSSYASFGVDPTTLDSGLGSSSYNLATMAQTLPNSLDTIRTVQKSHSLRRIILCIGVDSLQHVPQYDREVTFLLAKALGESPMEALHDVATLAFDSENYPKSKSLTWLFPWCYDCVQLDSQSIAANIRLRLETSDPTGIMQTHDSRWHYLGGGHFAYDAQLDYSTLASDGLEISEDAEFLDKNAREFTRLLDACAADDIPVYVVIAPRPDYANLAHQGDAFAERMASLQALATEHGATYFDFNLAKPEFYRPRNEDFTDPQHLNVEGSVRFSQAIGSAVSRFEAGEDVGGSFFSYEKWDEYLDSYEDVALCCCSEGRGEEVVLTAYAITRPNIKVEYRFEVSASDGDYEVVRGYATGPTYVMPIPTQEVSVRVTARAVGSTDEGGACVHRLSVGPNS